MRVLRLAPTEEEAPGGAAAAPVPAPPAPPPLDSHAAAGGTAAATVSAAGGLEEAASLPPDGVEAERRGGNAMPRPHVDGLRKRQREVALGTQQFAAAALAAAVEGAASNSAASGRKGGGGAGTPEGGSAKAAAMPQEGVKVPDLKAVHAAGPRGHATEGSPLTPSVVSEEEQAQQRSVREALLRAKLLHARRAAAAVLAAEQPVDFSWGDPPPPRVMLRGAMEAKLRAQALMLMKQRALANSRPVLGAATSVGAGDLKAE